jgi:membrane protein
VLTIGLVLALYFSSSAVEALRMGLNRAYGVRETREWWVTRLESIAFVIGGAFVMLVLAVLVVLGPSCGARALLAAGAPLSRWPDRLSAHRRRHRVIVVGPHGRLQICAIRPSELAFPSCGRPDNPAPVASRRPRFRLVPGIYPGAYASTYGGLATAMVALVFLYTLGAIFLFGGELNGHDPAGEAPPSPGRPRARPDRASDRVAAVIRQEAGNTPPFVPEISPGCGI